MADVVKTNYKITLDITGTYTEDKLPDGGETLITLWGVVDMLVAAGYEVKFTDQTGYKRVE